MTQPGKFEPSFVDPTEKRTDISRTQPNTQPVVKKDEGGKRKFRDVLERKLEKLAGGEDVSEEIAEAESTGGGSSSLFSLAASKKKGEISLDDEGLASLIEMVPVDEKGNKPTQATAAEIERLNALKKDYPIIPDPHELYELVKKEKVSYGPIQEGPKQEELQPSLMAPSPPASPTTGIETVIRTPDRLETAASERALRLERQEAIALVEKLVSELVVLTKSDRTETQITLQHPPIFEGATLVVTEFTSAKKEFNLSFFDLSPDARAMIANTQNQDLLRAALVEKGYTLQMITIEAKAEPPLTTAKGEGLQERDKKDDSQDSSDEGGVT